MHRSIPSQVGVILASASAFVLVVCLAGCGYSNMDVGNGSDISAEQMRAYSESESGGLLPTPIDDYPGKGGAVQMDRMVTVDISFSDPDNKPLGGTSHIKFLHSANGMSLTGSDKYTLGYVSPKLLDAMAGMRAGGRRRVQITDSTCEGTSQSELLNKEQCWALGAVKEGPYSERFGGVSYPRGQAVIANIFIAEVCKPWIVIEHRPDLMGGGPSQKLIYVWCR